MRNFKLLPKVKTPGQQPVYSCTAVMSTSIPPPYPRSANWTKPSEFARPADELRRLNRTFEESEYFFGKHRSNALELVHQVPVIEVDGEMAICDGGGGHLGHPLEYISLKRPGEVVYCKYCSLRFTKKV